MPHNLVFKGRKLLVGVLPESLSKEISIQDQDRFAGHVRDLPVDPGWKKGTPRFKGWPRRRSASTSDWRRTAASFSRFSSKKNTATYHAGTPG